MSDKSLELFMKNLSAKIKYNEVSQASWGGSKNFKSSSSSSSSSSLKNPSLDYLLNSADKLDREQKSKNRMLEEYRGKQEQPVLKVDEYGQPITGLDGKTISFKYHNIPSPELNLSDERFRFINPVSGRLEFVDIPYEDFNIQTKSELLNERLAPNITEQNNIKQLLRERERQKEELNDILNKLLSDKEGLKKRALADENLQIQNQIFGDENITGFRPPKTKKQQWFNFGEEEEEEKEEEDFNFLKYEEPEPEIKFSDIFARLLHEKDLQIDDVRRELERVEDDIEALKQHLKDLQDIKEAVIENFEEFLAIAENRKKENKQKLDAYYTELQNINSGKFNAEKMFNETDEQYLNRLERLADTPKDDQITLGLSIIDQKKTLRENLKEIVRDNQIINQVVNELNPELIFQFNKIFEIFKTNFLKKYGYDNKNIRYQDIIAEFVNLMAKQQRDILLLNNGNPTQIQKEDDLGDFASIYPESQNLIESTSTPLKSNTISARLLDNNETLMLISGANNNRIYLRYKIDPQYLRPVEEETKSGAKSGAKKVGRKKGEYEKLPSGVYFLYSGTNEDGEYRQVPSFTHKPNIYNIISNFLEVPMEDILRFFRLNPAGYIAQGIGKARLLERCSEMGLKQSTKTGYIAGKTDKGRFIIGEGVNKEHKDKKVKFGDVVIMPNKLFYDNILSISRPDGIKINGWKNKRVSDDLVIVLIKMLEKRDDYNRELNKLSSVERVLLDNLLSVANLHKKVITGTGNESIKKLKEELQLLEGEIQAGNNNESLKKKLHDILHKLAYFKVISLTQATKHYKEYLKNFF
jgi:hypothetical protein